MPPCTGCAREYVGFGATCGACRRGQARTVQFQRCGVCGEYFAGNGSVCADCTRSGCAGYSKVVQTPLEKWKVAACDLCAAGNGGANQSWSFEGWLGSLTFGRDLAGRIAKLVCPEGKPDSGFLLAFLRTMPQEPDLKAVEELLQQAGALAALARALAEGARNLREAEVGAVGRVGGEKGGGREEQGAAVAGPRRHRLVAQLCEELCEEVQAEVGRAEGSWRPVKEALFPKDASRDGWCWSASVKKLRQSMSAHLAKVVIAGDKQAMEEADTFLRAARAALAIREWYGTAPELTTTLAPGNAYVQCALESARPWQQLPNVRVLDCADMPGATDDLVRAMVAWCPNVSDVSFRGCHKLTDSAVRHLTGKCPGLQMVDFGGCGGLTDAAARHLAGGCQGLRVVSLRECGALTDNGVRLLAEGCRDLEAVDFTSCDRLTDEAARHLAAGCKRLLSVHLGACGSLTDAAGVHLAEGCRSLQTVTFSACGHVTDGTIRRLAEACADLRSVDFSFCEDVTDDGVVCLAEGCKGLRLANFDCCPRVTHRAARRLREALPACEVRR